MFLRIAVAVLASVSFRASAQEPMTFEPIVVDYRDGEVVYSGILIDEATFAELGTLRVSSSTFREELSSFEEWRDDERARFDLALGEMSSVCRDGNDELVRHYESALESSSKRTFVEQHGYPVGVAVGFVSATVLAVGSVYAMGQMYNVSIVR